jgi:FAD synthetase
MLDQKTVGAQTLERVKRLEPATTASAIRAALEVIHEAFQRYSSVELAMSFNGGKDCLIVLHLLFAYLSAHPEHALPRIVYFYKHDDFAEMLEFMRSTAAMFNFQVEELDLGGFKQGLAKLREDGVRACFMGQRRTDPFAPSTPFASTSSGWPEMMRVNPILDLDYPGVWSFLRTCEIKYCSLYDEGYTSLGSKHHTVPHPKLSSSPAHTLQEGEDERAGRNGAG